MDWLRWRFGCGFGWAEGIMYEVETGPCNGQFWAAPATRPFVKILSPLAVLWCYLGLTCLFVCLSGGRPSKAPVSMPLLYVSQLQSWLQHQKRHQRFNMQPSRRLAGLNNMVFCRVQLPASLVQNVTDFQTFSYGVTQKRQHLVWTVNSW